MAVSTKAQTLEDALQWEIKQIEKSLGEKSPSVNSAKRSVEVGEKVGILSNIDSNMFKWFCKSAYSLSIIFGIKLGLLKNMFR